MSNNAPPQELILASTSSSSPLPSTTLHALQTGAQLWHFKTPNASTSTTSTSKSSAASKLADKEEQTLADRKTLAVVEGSDGLGGFLLGLGGKDGRSGVNLWGFQKEQVVQRLIPPVRLATIALARSGLYLAGGTLDGRIFFWEVSSGALLLTIDAHYRAISVLEFTSDDAALVSGSEDSGVSVWSVGGLLSASPMNSPTPFATLSDHTLPITSIAIGLGAFPQCRVLTASLDSTAKIWDISTSPPVLLSTFSFNAPVHLVTWDPLERFFFASGPDPSSETHHRVVKVPLYLKKSTSDGFATTEPLVGNEEGGRVQAVVEKMLYSVSERITSLSLSPHSPTLLIGTSTSSIHILALPSLLPTRIIPPPPSTTPPGPITFLSTILRPTELASSAGPETQRTLFKTGLGRTIVLIGGSSEGFLGGGEAGRKVEMRIPLCVDVAETIRIPSSGLGGSLQRATGHVPVGTEETASAVVRVGELENEVERLKQQLGKAVQLNEGMWKKIVEGSLGGKEAELGGQR